MKEVENISKAISDFSRKSRIIFGVSQDNSYKDKIRISLLAVGLGQAEVKKEPPAKPAKPEVIKVKVAKSPKVAKPKIKRIKKPVNKKEVKSKPKIEIKKPAETPPAVLPLVGSSLIRRTALDLKKAVDKTADELLEQEKKWDIPAFLRRKEASDNQ